ALIWPKSTAVVKLWTEICARRANGPSTTTPAAFLTSSDTSTARLSFTTFARRAVTATEPPAVVNPGVATTDVTARNSDWTVSAPVAMRALPFTPAMDAVTENSVGTTLEPDWVSVITGLFGELPVVSSPGARVTDETFRPPVMLDGSAPTLTV